MRRFNFLIAAAAIVGFAGSASAGLPEPEPLDPHGVCVEEFNAEWGPPGQNVGPGARADENARERNALRKEACDPLKGNDEEVDPLNID